MKKNKKLALNRETLRRLGDDAAVTGGILPSALCNSKLCTVTEHPVGCGGQTNAHIWC